MPGGTCLNCGAGLNGPFCANCGQKVRSPDPTIREFLRETTQELTHWDGKVPTTLTALFTKPGQLTLDLLRGRRARWLAPLRLYLICSLTYFLSVPLSEAVSQRPSRQVIRAGVVLTDSTAITPEERAALDTSWVTQWLGKERVDRLLDSGADVNRTIAAAFPKAMFVLVPLFAWLTNLAYRTAAPRYPAHLYFALHIHAAAFGALAVAKLVQVAGVAVLDVVFALAALAYIAWHAFRAARVVFGGSFGKTLVKFVAVGLAYWIFFVIVSVGLVAYALARV